MSEQSHTASFRHMRHYCLRAYLLVAMSLELVLCVSCRRTPGGQSAAHPRPVSDGQIVLVRKSNEVGAFILSNQVVVRAGPIETGRMDYAWFYRKDGNGLLDPSSPSVTSGCVTGASQVAFGGFSVPWSMCGQGSGWVYYSALPMLPRGRALFEMCVTSETNIATIDGLDPKWAFQQRPPPNWKEFLGDGIDTNKLSRVLRGP